MKIKYLKPAPLGNTGDIGEVPDHHARVLIRLGIAEPYNEAPKRQRTKHKEPQNDLLSE
ncbi:hypothetical protein ACFBZI_07605 [Moraxella sp. ZJ142]|uniref:hypothetical protein n=1 Tax=Moraxella marmotae TaxID=3344520 RepID=UPI0035D5098E